MIVITGGTGALGKELVKLFKGDGKTVVSIARTENPEADYNFRHDLQKGDAIVVAAKQVEEIDETLEIIINAAGVFTAQPLGEITEDEIKKTMAVNLKASILMVSTLIERIKKDGTDIVNVASMGGVQAAPGIPVYGPSKWAVRGFSTDLQAALRDYPSRVMSFCPSSFESDILEKTSTSAHISRGESRMDAKAVAVCMKQLLELPKDMEIKEILLNRKGYDD